jgi:hypothetical protein
MITGLIRRAARLVAMLALVAGAMPAMAADKALLIGVGKFTQMDGHDLPGIDTDVDTMQGVAKRLGYGTIIELRNEQATRRAILDQLERALVTEASPEDRVMIYFSGHGTRIDVEDAAGKSEVHSAILASDAHVTTTPDGSAALHGVVVGSEFGALFARSKVRSIMLLVDACHSGSIDRAIHLGRPVMGNHVAVPKFFAWPGMPSSSHKAIAIGMRKGDPVATARYVSLSAAGDEESALATESGSMFTVGVSQAIADMSADGTVTPRQIVAHAADYIAHEAPADQVFHPEAHGPTGLIEAPVRLSDTRAGGGPNWNQALKVVEGLPGFAISGLQPRYREGQEVKMTFALPAQGYLNVIAIGPDDTVTLLFPNQNQPQSLVQAGAFALPGDLPRPGGNEIYFPVVAPFGKTLITAILTTKPMNLYDNAVDANGGKSLRTPSLAAIRELVAAGNADRAIAVGLRKSADIAAWSAKAEVLTCAAAGC